MTSPTTAAPAVAIPRHVLPGLVAAQLLGVSLWFSSSAAAPSLMAAWGLSQGDVGALLSAVQAGFIVGTLFFALTNLADRVSASLVFFASALAGAADNLVFAYAATGLADAMAYRFITGFALAGIYPVGMKIVVSWGPQIVGKSLGWLVGALTLGTALPFLLAALGAQLPWQLVLASTSVLAVISGLWVLWLGNGPYHIPARRVQFRLLYQLFRIPGYRGAAFGYFGHMWERPVAAFALAGSALMCLVTPWLLALHPWVYLVGLVVWGVLAVTDSPQFSALVSQACPPEYVATAFTVQNGIGFAITIVSIAVSTHFWPELGVRVSWLSLPGPLIGLILLMLPANRTAGT
jgi:MFS family permease